MWKCLREEQYDNDDDDALVVVIKVADKNIRIA